MLAFLQNVNSKVEYPVVWFAVVLITKFMNFKLMSHFLLFSVILVLIKLFNVVCIRSILP